MIAVDKLKTTTSALLILLDCGRYPASAMHVKKLSIARARQYNDISIRLLFFSIANPRPGGNVPMATIGILHLLKILNRKQVHIQADAQYTDRNKLDLAVPIRPFANIV